MTQCPHCGKRLLSHASACCNWCGATINDAEYQAQAQAEREAYFAQAAAHDAQSLAAAEALLVTGAAYNPWMLAPAPSRQQAPPATSREAAPLLPNGTSARMPARGTRSVGAQASQQAASGDASGEPIPSEAEEAGERFRHLEL